MNTFPKLTAALSLPVLALASCAYSGTAENGEDGADGATAPTPSTQTSFITTPEPMTAEASGITISEMGEFERPWAIEFIPGTDTLVITEKEGTIKMLHASTGDVVEVTGVPDVAFGGQGGLGDVAFLESESEREDGRTIYLSWAEFGEDGETRGAAVGRGFLSCNDNETECGITDLNVIWRQSPKVEGRGHYSHRIAFSPDEEFMFVASGDRQKLTPAQDNSNTMGTIVRLNLDGTPAAGNPFADQGGVTAEIWSYGHRNILGMAWDAQGRLWDIEHGPAGGDEFNIVIEGANYGWPTRSYGEHYNGDPIPDHTDDDGFNKPAVTWTPVIAPGDMIFYTGGMFTDWQGDALIAGLSSNAVVRVEIDGSNANEAARYALPGRVRSIDQAPDGSIWVATDEGKLLKLSM